LHHGGLRTERHPHHQADRDGAEAVWVLSLAMSPPPFYRAHYWSCRGRTVRTQARTVARYPIDEMALLLGITRDTYTKYDGRRASLMPHNLIVPFCLACRVSVEWLLTGVGPTRSR